jgi:hypothetical protein
LREREIEVKKYTDSVYYPEKVVVLGGGGISARLRSCLNDEILLEDYLERH